MRRTTTQTRQRGLSIVELLVGIAVGLFIVGGATKLFVDYIVDNRKLLVETRVHQDLRAAADLITRDLRRAGYWAGAASGIVAAGASAPAASNPFRTQCPDGIWRIVCIPADGNLLTGEMIYKYDRAASDAGFRVSGGSLEMKIGGGGWQAVTDPSSIIIGIPPGAPAASAAAVTEVLRTVDLYTACPCYTKSPGCGEGTFKNPDPATGAKGIYYDDRPRLLLRQYSLTLRGYAPNAPTVQREIRETVRVRNDEAEGTCPTI